MINFIARMFHCGASHSGSRARGEGNAAISQDEQAHEIVDLGLSVRWATCNLGADTPSDYGQGFAWGETSTKEGYWLANCQTVGQRLPDIAGQSQNDAARNLWAGRWRMPTLTEVEELISHCDWIWAKVDGKRGYLVKSRSNANAIFLPAADDRLIYGRYWTSTPYPDSTQDAHGLYFDRGSVLTNRALRYTAQCIRPVID